MEGSGNWFSYGVSLFEEKDYSGAITAFDKAISFNQYPVDAWFNRGLVYAEMGRFRQALDSFDETLTLDPGHEDAKTARIMVLERMKNQQSAPSPLAALTSRISYSAPRAVSRPAPSNRDAAIRSPILAAAFSFIFPGWGQWYNGRRWDGLFFLVASILLALADMVLTVLLGFNFLIYWVFMAAGFCLWIFCIWNAFTTAEKINRGETGFTRKSRLFWLPVLVIVFTIVLLVFSLYMAFMVFGMAASADPLSAGSMATGPAYHTRVVAATAIQPDSNTIQVTYHGGPDALEVRQVIVIVTDPAGVIETKSMGSPGSATPLAAGSSVTLTGSFTGKDRVLATAVFADGSDQVILDSFI